MGDAFARRHVGLTDRKLQALDPPGGVPRAMLVLRNIGAGVDLAIGRKLRKTLVVQGAEDLSVAAHKPC